MMMSKQNEDEGRADGHTRVTLGPVERWLVGITVTVIVGVVVSSSGWVVTSVQSMLERQASTKTQLDSIDVQLQSMRTQLADVASLKIEIAKTEIRVDQHDQDIRELKQLRQVK